MVTYGIYIYQKINIFLGPLFGLFSFSTTWKEIYVKELNKKRKFFEI
jgi:hypothetical protein